MGKDGHHAVALDRDGKRLHDAALVNSEARLRQVFDKLAQRGPVLMVVDQPATRPWQSLKSWSVSMTTWPANRPG